MRHVTRREPLFGRVPYYAASLVDSWVRGPHAIRPNVMLAFFTWRVSTANIG